jgi:hypothetical protein
MLKKFMIYQLLLHYNGSKGEKFQQVSFLFKIFEDKHQLERFEFKNKEQY